VVWELFEEVEILSVLAIVEHIDLDLSRNSEHKHKQDEDDYMK
jgi:hypothetical protein